MADATRAIFHRDGIVTVAGVHVGKCDSVAHARGRTYYFKAIDGMEASASLRVLLQGAAIASYHRIREKNPLRHDVLIHV